MARAGICLAAPFVKPLLAGGWFPIWFAALAIESDCD
jgi:hypothetical protein